MNFRISIIILFLLLVSANFSCKKEKSEIEESYSPTTGGSKWVYDGYLVEPTTNEMTGRTFKKFDKVFYEKNVSTIHESYEFYGTKVGDNYYTIVSDPNDINAENEVLFLKANASVDETWVNEIKYGSNSLGTQWKYKILEKGISKTVNGTVYANVIHTERMSNGLTLHSYYALGIGLIEVNYSNGASSRLKSYDIR